MKRILLILKFFHPQCKTWFQTLVLEKTLDLLDVFLLFQMVECY